MGSLNSKNESKIPLNDYETKQGPMKNVEETKFESCRETMRIDNEQHEEENISDEEQMVQRRQPTKEDLYVIEDGIIKAFKVHPEKVLTGKDLTWHGKHLLYKNHDIRSAYEKAIQISISNETELTALVSLLADGNKSEVESFSAICRWICANITMDESCTWNNDLRHVINGKKTSAEGFCKLLENMCRFANIKCRTISGIAKGPGYYPGFRLLEKGLSECPFLHNWNKVFLKGSWYLLDLTWAAGTYENGNFQRDFDDTYLICDPIAFGWLHLPLEDDGEVGQKDQLLREPWKTIDFWAKRVVQSLPAKALGMQPRSHTEGIIRTENNKCHLIFHCPYPLKLFIKLVGMKDQTEVSDFVMSYQSNKEIHVKVHLPSIGSYLLTIEGLPVYTTDVLCDKPKQLFLYTVMGLCRKPQFPFPRISDTWGLSAKFHDAKFLLLKNRQAQIYAEQGKATVSFVVPTSQWIPISHKVTYLRDQNKEMKNLVYIERDMNLLNVIVVCSDVGEYLLSMSIPVYNDLTTEIVQETCNFLLVCLRPNCHVVYPSNEGVWGPTKEGHMLGLTFEDLHSTKVCHYGECEVAVAKSRPVELNFTLFTVNDEKYAFAKRCVFVESMGNEIIFHIRIPKVGLYKFQVDGREAGGSGSMQIVMTYLIDIRQPYGGDLYSSREASVNQARVSRGVSTAFLDLGLQCNYMDSIVMVDVGPVLIEFTGDACEDLLIMAEMTEEGSAEKGPVERMSFAMVRGRNQVTFVLNFPPGKSSRFITDRDDNTSLTNHLVSFKAEACEKDDFVYHPIEQVSDCYGPVEGFSSYFSTIIDSSWYIRSSSGEFVFHQTLLKPLGDNELILELVQNGDRIKGAFYAELNGKDIKYHVHAPKAGFYRFTGYIEGAEVFNYLLHADQLSKSGFPFHKSLWGITRYGFQQGVSLGGKTLSSTLDYVNGKASLDIQLKNLDPTLQLINYDSGENSCESLWVEYGNSSMHITICPTVAGMFTLLIQEKQNVIGRFLLVALEPSTLGFPKVVNFFRGCRLFEPTLNPLATNCEYYFELSVPRASFLELKDKYGRWKQSLPLIGGLFKGLVKVKASKALLVVACDDNDREKVLLEYEIK